MKNVELQKEAQDQDIEQAEQSVQTLSGPRLEKCLPYAREMHIAVAKRGWEK